MSPNSLHTSLLLGLSTALTAFAAECAPNGGRTRVLPTLYNLYPQQSYFPTRESRLWELDVFGNHSLLEQAAVYSGIPENASECIMGWEQGDPANRTFVVDAELAMIQGIRLLDFPIGTDTINFENVSSRLPYPDSVPALFDFTFWDRSGAAPHGERPIPCQPEIYWMFQFRDMVDTAHIYKSNDLNNSIYIDFTC